MKVVHQKSDRTNWESERAELIAERDQLMQLLAETEEAAAIALERQIATAVERVREDLQKENNKLRKELEGSSKASQEWAAERARLLAESERTAQMISGTDEAAAIALERQIATAVEHSRSEMNKKLSAQKEEHQRALSEIEGNRSGKFHKEMTAVVANVRAELEADADKLRKEIAGLKGERDQAKMQLADLQNEHSHCSNAAEHAATNAKLQAEVTRLREELTAAEQLVTEYEQLAAEREQTNKLLVDAVDKNREAVNEAQKTASETGKRELDNLRQSWDSERSKLANECSAATADRDRLKQELERVTNAAAQSERERNQLQKDLDEAMQALTDPSRSESKGETVDIDLIREETARVEQSLQAIIKAIEDPGAELSFVVRKNVERAQLDSYLQGLRFAAGDK